MMTVFEHPLGVWLIFTELPQMFVEMGIKHIKTLFFSERPFEISGPLPILYVLPSGKQPHNYGKSPFFMGKSTRNHHFQ
jgi:hypothetical protein